MKVCSNEYTSSKQIEWSCTLWIVWQATLSLTITSASNSAETQDTFDSLIPEVTQQVT